LSTPFPPACLPAIVFFTFTNPTGNFQHSALLWLVFTSLIRTLTINPLSPQISIHFFYKHKTCNHTHHLLKCGLQWTIEMVCRATKFPL
jgi:hypothetical protein